MSEECVERWRDNRPLSSQELIHMRIQAAIRVLLIAAVLAFVAVALCGCRTVCAQQGQFPALQAEQIAAAEPSFEGVTIVAAVQGLTDFAPGLRAKAAFEADRVLRQLAERKLPGKVQTRLIAEVAEPRVFRNFEAVSGMPADPVLIHVLVPAKNTSLVRETIRKYVAELASSHFLNDLQRYRLLVTFERTSPGDYQMARQIAQMREPPRDEMPPTQPAAPSPIQLPPLPASESTPDGSGEGGSMIVTMITAWLTERSKLAAKVVAAYQRFKGRFA